MVRKSPRKNSQKSLGPESSPIPEVKVNSDIPDHRFQVLQKVLFENEFEAEEAYVAAHLQRLQHGTYKEPKRMDLCKGMNPHVTFVAITFVFHAMHSRNHRFKRAQISVLALKACKKKVNAADQPLRILKFSPHIAYGRMSTESLHWTFSLSGTIGVTKPFTASVTPSTEYGRTKVMGTMMDIQGSTRTSAGVSNSKVVWSLEENDQQETGLPREFTFIILLEQPVAKASLTLKIGVKPVFAHDMAVATAKKIAGHDTVFCKSDVLDEEAGQKFSSSPFNFATMEGQFEDLVELPGIASNIKDIPNEVSTPANTLTAATH